MNSSMPRQGQPMGRELDTSQMDSSPKWPIVLIAILAILIVVVVLLIFRPWDALQANNPATGDQQGNVSTQTGDQQTGQDQQVVTPPLSDPSQGSDATTVTDPSVPAVDPAVAANEALFQNLSAYYGELAGLDAQISATATDFNNNYTSSDLATRQAYASAAATLYATINTNLDALNAMVVAPSSPYYTTWQNMVTLYSCLSNRIRVISEAWNLAVVDPYDGQISAILSADNVGGVNKYKTQYQELYPVSQPVQQ